MYEFAAHSCCSQLPQRVVLVALLRADRDLLDLVGGHHTGPPQAFDDSLCTDALFNQLFDFFEDLASENHHRRCAIAHLRILRSCNVC